MGSGRAKVGLRFKPGLYGSDEASGLRFFVRNLMAGYVADPVRCFSLGHFSAKAFSAGPDSGQL